MRIDKMGVVLNYGQTPLIKSRYLEYINKEEQPYGVNTIVAIMSYTGYNVEDAILINEASIKRGLFNTTYFTMYESKEESSKVSGTTTNSFFTNIETKQNISGLKPGYEYNHLDQFGLIKENTMLHDKIMLIGQLASNTENKDVYVDQSVKPKKGQLGVVDKSFMTEGEEGFRIAKVRIREERIPAIGDKMASRAGQKGTIGLIIPEQDMPFTADGIRPDLIINPHAIPSRMTIGQLVESLFGKACAMYGAYGDCTAFSTKGANADTYGKMLTRIGYHSSGNQILYNGMSGEQIFSDIYIGPTYYMRLKHMVKDKINYRARGPRTALTRQTVQGRANDGGLRIGEMERDGILAHGASYFLTESYMVRGDEYYMAVCNKSGAIAIFNPSLNLFLSPFADGPLKFNTTIDGKLVLDVFSVYGRSFSVLRIPYSLKLLIQELQVMNIQMRVITEDNIDQLLNLSYQSKNIEKLLHIDLDTPEEQLKTFLQNYKKNIQNTIYKTNTEIQTKEKEKEEMKEEMNNTELQDVAEFESPETQYPEPEYSQPEYPESVSPAYQPQTPVSFSTSDYIPGSNLNSDNSDNSDNNYNNSNSYNISNSYNNSNSNIPQVTNENSLIQQKNIPEISQGNTNTNTNADLDFENNNYIKKPNNEATTDILNVEEPIDNKNENENESGTDNEKNNSSTSSSSSGETKSISIV
jgi:hypothetical protein